jgi:hypothetical protein
LFRNVIPYSNQNSFFYAILYEKGIMRDEARGIRAVHSDSNNLLAEDALVLI